MKHLDDLELHCVDAVRVGLILNQFRIGTDLGIVKGSSDPYAPVKDKTRSIFALIDILLM